MVCSQSEGTNPGSLVHTFGGVARNVAECMARLGTPPFFITAVGDDENGQLITRHLEESGMVSHESHDILRYIDSPNTHLISVKKHTCVYTQQSYPKFFRSANTSLYDSTTVYNICSILKIIHDECYAFCVRTLTGVYSRGIGVC